MIEFETELPFMVAVFYPIVLILAILLVSPVGVMLFEISRQENLLKVRRIVL